LTLKWSEVEKHVNKTNKTDSALHNIVICPNTSNID